MFRFATILLFLTLTVPVTAQDLKVLLIHLGPINKRAKSLPMPQLANVIDIKGLDEIAVRVKLDLQKGDVIDAEIESGGHPLVDAAVIEAAKGAKFEPVLPDLPSVQGSGLIIYKHEDFNKPAVNNENPRRFLIINKEILNDKAKTLVKPKGVSSGKEFIAGRVEVAVLIPVTGGDVIAANAVSGPEELRGVSEKAAMKVKFQVAFIDGDVSGVYITGKIVYRFDKNGKVE